jgi:hypothetical protein
VVLVGLLDIIEPGQHWARKLITLLRDHSWDITPLMGFPSDWRERTLWKKHLS